MKKLISTYIILCLVYSCSKSDSINNTTKNFPGSPILLTASFDTNYLINLKWIDSSSNESGFKIERKIGTGSYNIVGTVAANVCTYIDYITYPNTTYTYRVNAFNNDGNSLKYTNEVTITPTNLKDSLIVTLSRDTVENNGWDMVSIHVKDTAGNDVTKKASLFLNSDLNSSPIFNNVYYPTAIGNYTISATMGSISSNKSPLIVVPYTRSAFTHKILVEDYTSMYCGYCPRVFFELDTYTKTHSNCAWISIHTSGLGPDKYAYTYCSDMESKFSIQGYPTSIINRKLVWQEDNSTLMNEAIKWTGLGLSINSTVNGNTISGTANVKFNFTTNKPLKIVVAIVESGLFANQENYYSPGGPTPYLYNGKNPIPNFDHKFSLRATSTNVFGDSIPVASTFKNNIYSLPFTFNLNGLNALGSAYTLNPANCRIIAYVVDGSSDNWRYSTGVLNLQYAAVGNTQPFD